MSNNKFVFVQSPAISEADREWEGSRQSTAYAAYMARVIGGQYPGITNAEARDQALANFRWLTGSEIPAGIVVHYCIETRCGMVGFEKQHYWKHGKAWLAQVLELFHRRGWHFHTFKGEDRWYFHFPKREEVKYVDRPGPNRAETQPPQVEEVEMKPAEKKPKDTKPKVVRNQRRKPKEQINLEELEEIMEE